MILHERWDEEVVLHFLLDMGLSKLAEQEQIVLAFPNPKHGKWCIDDACDATGLSQKTYEIRMFRCDGITSCILLDETFLYPKNFTLRSYFNDTLQELRGKCALEEQYLVTMTVSEKAFRYLKGMEYSVIWHEEDQWRICVNLYLRKCTK